MSSSSHTTKSVLDGLKNEENPQTETVRFLRSFDNVSRLCSVVEVENFYKTVHTLWYLHQQIAYSDLPPELEREKRIRQAGLAAARSECFKCMVEFCLDVEGTVRRLNHRRFMEAIISTHPVHHVLREAKKTLGKVPLWFYHRRCYWR